MAYRGIRTNDSKNPPSLKVGNRDARGRWERSEIEEVKQKMSELAQAASYIRIGDEVE